MAQDETLRVVRRFCVRARELAGSGVELARQLGMEAGTVNGWTTGSRSPHAEILVRMVRLYASRGLSFDEFALADGELSLRSEIARLDAEVGELRAKLLEARARLAFDDAEEPGA